MTEVTRILAQVEAGDSAAAAGLLPLVYTELRRLAAAKLQREHRDGTLQPTALVHEAYLRLVDVDRAQHWNSRGHFFAAAAEAMRRILVEQARRKASLRHGGNYGHVAFSEQQYVPPATSPDPEMILAVDEAVTALAADAPLAADIVKLHFFVGRTLKETAEDLGISRATVYRQWAYARAVLKLAIRGEADDFKKPEIS